MALYEAEAATERARALPISALATAKSTPPVTLRICSSAVAASMTVALPGSVAWPVFGAMVLLMIRARIGLLKLF